MKKKLPAVVILFAPIVVGGTTHLTSGFSASAQRDAARDTTGCLDTLHASDSVSAVVTMSVQPQDSKLVLPRDFEGLFVQEFRSRLKVPEALPLGVMIGWTPCDSVGRRCTSAVLELGSHAYVTAHPTGKLSRIGVIDFSLTPAFSDSVRAVLERISRENMSPFFTSKDSIPLEIEIRVEQHSDTVPSIRHLFRVTIPHYAIPFTYPEWPKNAKGPKYPRVAEGSGASDSIALTFTILPDGSIAPHSVDLQSGHYTDFIRSVFDKLATTRYVPARLGGCQVASWTRFNFLFRGGIRILNPFTDR